MSNFKTQKPYSGFKVFNNNTYPTNVNSLSSMQVGDNFDSIDEILQRNLSQEEKSTLVLRFFKTCKINTDTYPFERLLR